MKCRELSEKHRIFPRAIAALTITVCVFGCLSAARASERLVETEAHARELVRTWTLDSVRESIALWRQAGEGWLDSGDAGRADECFAEAALGAQMLGDYPLAEEILGGAGKHSITNTSANTTSLAVLALLKLERGDFVQAEKFSRVAVSRAGSPRARAFAHFSRGSYEYYYGQSAESLRLFEKAHDESLLTDDKLLQTNAAVYRAYALLREGRPFEALPLIAGLAQACDTAGDQKCRVQAEIGTGFVAYFMSDLQKALDAFRRAESLLPRDFEFMDRARVLTATGIVYSDLGENQTAVALLEGAIKTYEPTGYKAGQTTTLTFLAENLALSGRTDAARDRFLQALDIARSINDKFRVAGVYEGLGLLAHRAGRYAEAIGHYRSAIENYRTAGVRIPVAEMLLANAHRELGDYDAAEAVYRAVTARDREIRDNRQLAECLYEFAVLLERMGRTQEALAAASESVTVTEKLYSQVTGSGLRQSFVSSVFNRYELLLRLGLSGTPDLSDPESVRAALELSERARARSMIDSVRRVRADLAGNTSDAERRERELLALLSARAERLTQILSSNAPANGADALKTDILRLERELDRLRAESKSDPDNTGAFGEPDIDRFRREFLDDRTVLLEFFTGKRESYVWVVTREKIGLYRAAPIDEIAKGLTNLRAQIAERNAGEFTSAGQLQEQHTRTDDQLRIELSELGSKLLGAVPGYFEEKRLLIVGDPAIEGVPFGALAQPNDPQRRALIENNEIIFLPSARFLTQKELVQSGSERPGLVVSDAVYSLTDDRLSASGARQSQIDGRAAERSISDWQNLTRLTGSADEGEKVADFTGVTQDDRLSGFDASRENVLARNLRTHGILHFATHGVVFSSENSLSGLVLSRFDRNGSVIDSMLRLQDVYSMRLSADLVVLSACETGIGPEIRGEGLLSLNNAFLQSGARSVVSTLWKVDDQATLELMTEFYRLMADDRKPPVEALRLAQLKLRSNPRYSSPFYWAAFTFHGDFRATPNFPRQGVFGRNRVMLGTAALATILIAIAVIIRRRVRM